MNELKKQLNLPVEGKSLKVWHVILGITLFWTIPNVIFYDGFLAQWAFPIFIAWCIFALIINYYMKKSAKVSHLDTVLFERVLILITFGVPAVRAAYGVLSNAQPAWHWQWSLAFSGIATALIIISIIVHLLKKRSTYHGVKKDDLFL